MPTEFRLPKRRETEIFLDDAEHITIRQFDDNEGPQLIVIPIEDVAIVAKNLVDIAREHSELAKEDEESQ